MNFLWLSSLLLAADWSQTVYGVRHHRTERNVILGPSPSVGQVNTYFVGAMASNLVLAAVLPPKWERAVQITVIGAETVVITKNWRAGVRFGFNF